MKYYIEKWLSDLEREETSMESLNKEKDLWSNVSAEVMESRDEFGCLFDFNCFLDCICFECICFH